MEAWRVPTDWRQRGFSCALWTDPPGQVWADFVHPVDERLLPVEGELELTSRTGPGDLPWGKKCSSRPGHCIPCATWAARPAAGGAAPGGTVPKASAHAAQPAGRTRARLRARHPIRNHYHDRRTALPPGDATVPGGIPVEIPVEIPGEIPV